MSQMQKTMKIIKNVKNFSGVISIFIILLKHENDICQTVIFGQTGTIGYDIWLI